MSFFKHLKDRFRRDRVTLQLDDIQALILRSRPEPYVGIQRCCMWTRRRAGAT